MSLSADHPIDRPNQDAFGFDPFARAIAKSIAALVSPEGLVIGVHGPWGSGKSSAVNLIKYHLASADLKGAGDLTLLEFNPWWFSGADTLALAFFSELGSAISKSLPDKAKEAFQALGRKLGSASPLIEAAMNFATAGVAGGLSGGATKFVSDLLGGGRTVQEEHAELAKALRESNKRYLVIIDDLDRLSADDALLIFKLVKSVGRLPNVIYLMVFDRELTEAAVAERFPSEGAHFLEKIIQATFELPPPEADDLRNLLLGNVSRIMGDVEEDRLTRFMNIFFDVVAPNIARPRDVVRLTNALEVTWPAVAGDVDQADFLAVETFRLFWPQVHRAIYNNKALVCGHQLGFEPHALAKDECDRRLLASVPEAKQPDLRKALMRLFPALENAWSNRFYGADFGQEWRLQRRICVQAHFDPYFRFALSDQVAPATEIEAFIAHSGDGKFVREALRQALATPRRRRGTRAAILLDELTFRASQVPEANISPLVTAIFSIADELDVEADQAGALAIGDNQIRIHWLLNRLVGERLAVAERDAVLEEAAKHASLRWLVNFALRCVGQHEPKERERQRDEPLTSAEAAERLRALALARVEVAAAEGTFVQLPDFVSKLFRWRDLIGDGGVERVRGWLAEQLVDDAVVVALARSFVATGWTHAAGDVVARRITHLNRGTVEALVDPSAFRARIAELLANANLDVDSRGALEAFEGAWTQSDRGDFGD
ncbi:P-loop NTPase fold protein [Xanthobacter sp. KR7-225]|uniref:KAP family P-loop NTPase fold protein n=1 Tax=Xanthobacter sp. KR7-225 TaxID=3156613 RepID=UPI0032B55D8A